MSGSRLAKEAIKALIADVNAAWRSGDVSRLTSYFHEAVVIVPTGLEGRVVGRDACLASYADFARQAKVREFSAAEPQIDVFGETAVALCPFLIDYEFEEKRYREKGHDLLVLSRQPEGWQVVWRTLTFERDEPAG